MECNGENMKLLNGFHQCRLCLCKCGIFYDVLGVSVPTSFILADLISDLLQFEVNREDGYPQLVCNTCTKRLTEFKTFKEQCKSIKAAYDREFFKPDMNLEETNFLELDHRPIKLEDELGTYHTNVYVPASEEFSVEIDVKEECWDDTSDARSEVLTATRETSYVGESGSGMQSAMETCSYSNSYGNISAAYSIAQEIPTDEEVSVKLVGGETLNPMQGRLKGDLVGNEPQEGSSGENGSNSRRAKKGGNLPAVNFEGQPSTSQEIAPGDSPPQPSPSKIQKRSEYSHVITNAEELRILEEDDEEENDLNDFSEDMEWGDNGKDIEENEEDPSLDNLPLPPAASPPCPSLVATHERTGTTTSPAFTWTSQRPIVSPIPFTETPGINVPNPGEEPRKFFDLLMTEDILNMTVTETNRFAETILERNVAPKARVVKWKPLAIQEFLTFLGILLHMGTIPLSRIGDYWNTDFLFNFSCFQGCMSRDRFSGIFQCLHFARNPEPQEPQTTDKLFKIQPLVDAFNKTMDEIVSPTQNLYIDEPMVLWKGRLIFPTFMKEKNHNYRIKLYMLTEPSGLVLRFVVYTGSSDADVGGRGHVDAVVCKLMEGRLDAGHSLYMNSYYNSINLAHHLLERKTYCTGILRTYQKGNPPQVMSKKLKKGEIVDAFTNDGVCVLKWRERRDVLMISSEYGSHMVDVREGGGTTSKPEAIAKYNKSMGGIDHSDQIMPYYPLERKTMKWYKKLGIHIFHLLLLNSYYLYNKTHPKISLYDFRLSIIKSLLLPAYLSSAPSRTLGLSRHFPHTLPSDDKGKQKWTIQRRCRECYSRGVRKDTMYFCPACEGFPPLCLYPCFVKFHKMLKC